MTFGPIFPTVFSKSFTTQSGSIYLLLDNFNGSGALTSHIPDIFPTGSSWAIKRGTWGNLSGGRVPYTSTTFGLAIINLGIADFEMKVVCKAGTGASQDTGFAFRSNADGTNHYKHTFYPASTSALYKFTSLTASAGAGAIALTTPTFVAGTYYTFDIICKGADYRCYIDNVAQSYAILASYLTNTYVGLGNIQAFGNWESISAKAIGSWLQFSIMGDSISNNTNEWPYMVAARYNNGYCGALDHAASGSTIYNQMDGQTDSCETDAADFTIIALGTNDSLNIQAEYQENLQELYGTLGKPIYCMNVLNKTDETNRDTTNGYIAAAVSAAAAAGVNVTLWDTEGWIDPATDTSDGLHPTAAGQIKISNEILTRLP